jgi:hypothetical protein
MERNEAERKSDRLAEAEHLLGLALVALTESGADGFYHRPSDGRRVSVCDEINGFISRGCGNA